MITLRQLRYLDALSRTLHFGKAAEDCAVTQPALSQQIRELEAQLGVKLVDRSPQRVRLTPEGAEVARRARRILGEAQDLVDYAHHHEATLVGPLRLGAIPSIAPYLLPGALPRLNRQYPALDLHLRETRTQTLMRELVDGRLDVVVVALPVEEREVETLPLFEDRFLLAVQATEADALGGAVEPAIVDGRRLLLLEEGHCLRDQALSYCDLAGPAGLDSFGASSLATIMQMVANGYGVTLLPELCVDVEARDERIALLRFATPEPVRTVGLAWRRNSSRRHDFLALGQILAEAAGAPAASALAPAQLPAPEAPAPAQ